MFHKSLDIQGRHFECATTREKSSMGKARTCLQVPVVFGAPVPDFSMKTTLLLIPVVVMSGTTTPPIRNWYDPAALPVGVCQTFNGVPFQV
jgi:hypothetical protein